MHTDIEGFPGHPSDPAAGADGTSDIFQTNSLSTAQETFNYSCCSTNFHRMCVCVKCMLQGVFLTFASWPVLTEELMCAYRIPQAGRVVCVGEFCSCSFCVSESEPSAPAPVGHLQVRPLPRWAS